METFLLQTRDDTYEEVDPVIRAWSEVGKVEYNLIIERGRPGPNLRVCPKSDGSRDPQRDGCRQHQIGEVGEPIRAS